MEYRPTLEFAAQDTQRQLTAGLLRELFDYAAVHASFYRKRLAPWVDCVNAMDIYELWGKLPVTTREELESHNDAFCCVPVERLREIVCTSGTTGVPINVYLTGRDLEKLAVNEAYAFAAAGFSDADTVLLCVTMDQLFMAGMAYYLGLQREGCTVLRQGAGHPERQAELAARNRVTAMVTVPSFLLAVVRALRRLGYTPDTVPLRRAVLVGENLRRPDLQPGAVCRNIQAIWPVECYGSYGNTEMCGSMAECPAFAGCHVHPDVTYAEILDEQDAPLPAGQNGRLVVTTLQAAGTPLIRYDTGDVASLIESPCACGRRSPRLGPVVGRADQMLKIRGTKLYPAAVMDAVRAFDGVEAFILIADTDEHGSDQLCVRVAMLPEYRRPSVECELQEALRGRLRVRVQVETAPKEEILAQAHRPGYRKRVMFVDRRKRSERMEAEHEENT